MRAMLLEYLNDLNARALDRQYFLGDSLLAAPIFNEEGVGEVYLPAGTWTHYLSGETLSLEHGRWIRSENDYFSLPLWVRANSLIPTLDPAATADEQNPSFEALYGDRLRIEVFSLTESTELEIFEAGKKLSHLSLDVDGSDVTVSFEGPAFPLVFMNQSPEAVEGCSLTENGDSKKTVNPDEGAAVLKLKLNG